MLKVMRGPIIQFLIIIIYEIIFSFFKKLFEYSNFFFSLILTLRFLIIF